MNTDDIADFVIAIAQDEGYEVSFAPCGPAVHHDGRNLGIVTAPGHSVALYLSADGQAGLSIRDFTDGEAAFSAALDWIYQ